MLRIVGYDELNTSNDKALADERIDMADEVLEHSEFIPSIKVRTGDN
jgi:hypothetical protein